jgi:hypothetical protein
MTRQPNPVNFRSATVEPELRARTYPEQSLGQIAARDLTRYYVLLNQALRRVHELFPDQNEWALMYETALGPTSIMRGHGYDVQPHLFVVAIEDMVKLDNAHIRFGIADADDLLARLRSLTALETIALLDIVERWWIAQERTEQAERINPN